jgi:Arm DNA-binding domain
MPKLTKRTVDAATPEADRFIVWDIELKGFGLLVLPSGVKSYVYDYRTPEGLKRRITIGQHGPARQSRHGTRRRTIGRSSAPVAIL